MMISMEIYTIHVYTCTDTYIVQLQSKIKNLVKFKLGDLVPYQKMI